MLCAHGAGATDGAATAVAVLLAAAAGARLRTVHPPPSRPAPGRLTDPARVAALARAARRFRADHVVLGAEDAPGRAGAAGAELALRERRPVAVVRRAPGPGDGGWVLAQVPEDEALARAVAESALVWADALDRPLVAVRTVPGEGRRGRVALEGRAPATADERAALARLAAVLPEGDALERVHLQLRRGPEVAELLAAACELPAHVAVVAADAPALLVDRVHERLLAAGVAVVIVPVLPPPGRVRPRGRMRSWRLACGLGLAAAGLAALVERLLG